MTIEYFNLIDNEPFYVEGIGTLRSPTLRNIKRLGYDRYNYYLSLLVITLQEYMEIISKQRDCSEISLNTKYHTLYDIIIEDDNFMRLYLDIFSFFFCENVCFDKNSNEFVIVNEIETLNGDKELSEVSRFSEDKFEIVRLCLSQLNHLKLTEDKPVKYKNERARRIAEKLTKSNLQKGYSEPKLDLPHSIVKYCSINKVGINILNVMDISIFQFYELWEEAVKLRHINIQDMLYAHSVTLSNPKDYDAQQWLK